MKAIKRYLILVGSVAILCLIGYALLNHRSLLCWSGHKSRNTELFRFISNRKHYYDVDLFQRAPVANTNVINATKQHCRMDTCFDFSRCNDLVRSVKIYVYPIDPQRVSPTFVKITNFIKQSKYYESDPNKACLFISDVDTLDRDPLSPNFQKYQSNIALLNEGRNHLMFNLFSGSWPSYSETDFSGIDYPKYSILIKASMSYENYRPGFDISFPLFSRNHPERGPQHINRDAAKINFASPNLSIVEKRKVKSTKYLLVFKGKRYIYGIGSETRNSLYHLHNNRDILIYTTCKHGKKWKELVDERCEQDNLEYDKHDYQTLMKNSTFCLVPRGRRLGSFRFLEALSVGCIPVVLSNSWILPFSEVIDWSSAVILADERLLLQIPDQLRSISKFEIESMRAQCLFLYNTYFASIEKIIMTAISIIEDRINIHWARESFLWNVANRSPLSPLWIDHRYSDMMDNFPAYCSTNNDNRGFTAIITVSRVISVYHLNKFIKASLLSSKFLRKILIFWHIQSLPLAQINHLANLNPSIITIVSETDEANKHYRFNCCYNDSSIPTDAIFQLDPESNLITEEIDFAYLVWESFSDRIIGFGARDHYFDSAKNQWTYTSKWTNQYSIVLFDAAIYHKYFNFLYQQHMTANPALSNLSFDEECAGLSFNFLISHITRESPIKVTQRKKTINSETLFNSWMAWIDRKSCFQKLISLFGYIPLVKSKIRLEPLLYKDAVSSMRKKYRKLEMIV